MKKNQRNMKKTLKTGEKASKYEKKPAKHEKNQCNLSASASRRRDGKRGERSNLWLLSAVGETLPLSGGSSVFPAVGETSPLSGGSSVFRPLSSVLRLPPLVIWVICGLVCFTGCASTPKVASPKPTAPAINTSDGMINYLKGQNIPALKSVDTWQSKFGTGLKLTTTHYEVYTTLLEPLMLSEVPGFIESAYRGYQAQLPQPIETSTLFTVYLFASRQQWEVFTMDFTGPMAPLYLQVKRGAYYLNGACVAYNIGLEGTFSGIGHEGWHQFNSRYFKYRLPSWLDEGIAMQFETTAYDKGFFVFEPGRNINRLGSLKQTIARNNVIGVEELVGINPGEVVADGNNTIAFYSEAYAFVRFLREEEYGKRLLKYQKLLLDGLNGQWPLSDEDKIIAADRNIPITVGWNKKVGTELFERYIDPDFDKIQKEYLIFCRKIVYNVQLK